MMNFSLEDVFDRLNEIIYGNELCKFETAYEEAFLNMNNFRKAFDGVINMTPKAREVFYYLIDQFHMSKDNLYQYSLQSKLKSDILFTDSDIF